MNVGSLRSNSESWAERAAAERNVLELVAAAPEATTLNPSIAPLPFSPDVRLGDIPRLVADGAIRPRAATTPAEQALVTAGLSQPPPP
jgi:hypothetical protein